MRASVLKLFLLLAMITTMSVSLVGCLHYGHGGGYYGGGSGGGGGGDPYYDAWYDVYGNYCGSGSPTPGCNFYADGLKIIDIEDPYFSTTNLLYYDSYTFYDSYGYLSSYLGYAWESPTGILYDEYGWALNENGEERGKDIIDQAARMAENKVQQAGKSFASKFALSEATGVEVARTLQDWAQLGKKHSRTDKDIQEFSQRLYGVSMEKALVALTQAEQGDLSQVNELNTNIADHWGTSPETSKAILKNWYKDYLKDFGM